MDKNTWASNTAKDKNGIIIDSTMTLEYDLDNQVFSAEISAKRRENGIYDVRAKSWNKYATLYQDKSITLISNLEQTIENYQGKVINETLGILNRIQIKNKR